MMAEDKSTKFENLISAFSEVFGVSPDRARSVLRNIHVDAGNRTITGMVRTTSETLGEDGTVAERNYTTNPEFEALVRGGNR